MLLTAFLGLTAIPAMMVVLSMALPTRVNRTTNLVVASPYIPVTVFKAVGESWDWAPFLRSLHRNRGAVIGLHPAIRLDMAPHIVRLRNFREVIFLKSNWSSTSVYFAAEKILEFRYKRCRITTRNPRPTRPPNLGAYLTMGSGYYTNLGLCSLNNLESCTNL